MYQIKLFLSAFGQLKFGTLIQTCLSSSLNFLNSYNNFIYRRINMPVDIQSVLISDPVDEQCAQLLISHGIKVTQKYKLAKDDLIKELQVLNQFLY